MYHTHGSMYTLCMYGVCAFLVCESPEPPMGLVHTYPISLWEEAPTSVVVLHNRKLSTLAC